jgi:hypothetical protein
MNFSFFAYTLLLGSSSVPACVWNLWLRWFGYVYVVHTQILYRLPLLPLLRLFAVRACACFYLPPRGGCSLFVYLLCYSPPAG